MKKWYALSALTLLLTHTISFSQALTDSNLPIVIINTDGAAEIPDDPRILATMKIIWRGEGQRNYFTDQDNPAYLNYNGRINIEVRGSSSQAFDKKQYGLSTIKTDNISNNNVSLLGLPEDNDWILNCNIFDPSMMRNYLSFYLSRAIGEYSSRCVYCELILNDSYRGLYLLEEKIKPAPQRVNINRISSEDVSMPDVSGGYITKADKTTGGDPIAWTMSSYIGTNDVGFIHDVPEPLAIKPGQDAYIRNQFMKLASAAAYGNLSLENGYPSIIDVPSFIDFMLLNELASNADAYQFSTFFHKDRNGKLRAGPLWDMDLTYGNDLFIWGFSNRSLPDVWQFHNGDNEGPKFWRDLFNNQTFRCYLSRRWNQLTQPGQPFNLFSLNAFIDQTQVLISEAAQREQNRWGNIGNLSSQTESLKNWLQQRIEWMTANLGSFYSCSDRDLPKLVITKIMYAPDTTSTFPESKDLEFIEITNTGNETVSLAGVYFGGTGFVYCFPPSATIAAGESKILSGNAEVFMSKYGFYPFGQFSRALGNTGEKLLLLDAMGNVIDMVEYSDLPPWPDVKYNGFYLNLPDPLADNSLASNWVAGTSQLVPVTDVETEPVLKIYPSPVSDWVSIESEGEIMTLDLYNLTGNRIRTIQVNSNFVDVDMTDSPAGIYLLKVFTRNGSFVRKIVRE
jgi:hypothetical protein